MINDIVIKKEISDALNSLEEKLVSGTPQSNNPGTVSAMLDRTVAVRDDLNSIDKEFVNLINSFISKYSLEKGTPLYTFLMSESENTVQRIFKRRITG